MTLRSYLIAGLMLLALEGAMAGAVSRVVGQVVGSSLEAVHAALGAGEG